MKGGQNKKFAYVLEGVSKNEKERTGERGVGQKSPNLSERILNAPKLNQADWCFQRYVWEENLDPSKIPTKKIIKTLIYGVRSSGNQAEYGLRKVAELSAKEHPQVNKVVQKTSTLTTDCISGDHSIKSAHELADDIEIVLNKGGFQLKSVLFSGEEPLSKLTETAKPSTSPE